MGRKGCAAQQGDSKATARRLPATATEEGTLWVEQFVDDSACLPAVRACLFQVFIGSI